MSQSTILGEFLHLRGEADVNSHGRVLATLTKIIIKWLINYPRPQKLNQRKRDILVLGSLVNFSLTFFFHFKNERIDLYVEGTRKYVHACVRRRSAYVRIYVRCAARNPACMHMCRRRRMGTYVVSVSTDH